MTLWKLLLTGVPSQGVYKRFYDKQRKSTEEYKTGAAKRKRKRYQASSEQYREANRRYKEKFIAEHGKDAWNARNRAYLQKHREKKRNESAR